MAERTLEPTADASDNSEETIHEIQDVQKKANVRILVGFPGGRNHVPAMQRDDDGNPVVGPSIETAELAKMLHYGAKGIPSRPFLEEGIQEVQDKLKAAMKAELEKFMKGGVPNWDKIGTMAVGSIQEFVRSDHYKSTKPNSPATIEAKGSDTPLIDTADLINSLTFIVDTK